MDKEYFENLILSMKNEIIQKIDATAEGLNLKIEKNTNDIQRLENVQADQKEKIENVQIRSETNSDEINDIKMRLDKLEKEKGLNEQRFSSIEDAIDTKGDVTPPKVKNLITEVNKIKNNIDQSLVN